VLGLPVQSGWPTRVNLQNRDFDVCRRNFRAGDMRHAAAGTDALPSGSACTAQAMKTANHHHFAALLLENWSVLLHKNAVTMWVFFFSSIR
jgi:hypothetical protein